MAMNTAGTLTGCGGRQDLILVQVAKVLMETEIGIINGEVLYSSLFLIDITYFIGFFNVFQCVFILMNSAQALEVVEIDALMLTVDPNHFLKLKRETLETMYLPLTQFQFWP